jgi:hypothetical protein
VIDKQPWQIEQARKPGHDKNNMEGFDPEHLAM